MWNQGFATVFVWASAVSILLWSVAILRGRALPRAAGAFGLLVGTGVILWQVFGQQHLGVHQFGAIMLAEAAWLVWLGAALMRERGSEAS